MLKFVKFMTKQELEKQKIILSNNNTDCIIRQLLYYDIFDHPLTKEELLKDCVHPNESEDGFDELLNKELIFKINQHYSVRNDPSLSLRKTKGEELAQKLMPKAQKMSKLINKFPFVRAVALSGSISKGFMDDTTDVDYFVICKPQRVWLARTFLILYKKVFLLNSFRFFCLNYFIGENDLELSERNIFTATEINTLIPVCGCELFNRFFRTNNWVQNYYKNFPRNKTSEQKKQTISVFKKSLEFLLSNFIGNCIDRCSMKLTIKYWKWKYRKDSRTDLISSSQLIRNVAKYHPGNFQLKVIDRFNENLESFFKNKRD